MGRPNHMYATPNGFSRVSPEPYGPPRNAVIGSIADALIAG
jgi:hypothetical protein